MSLESLPPTLVGIKNVLFVGEGYSNRNTVLSYWIRYYGYKLGLSMVKTKQDLQFLLALEESLDALKASETKRRIHNPVYAQNYLESIAIKLFLWAEIQYRAEEHKKDSVLVFFTSALLLDICCFLFEDKKEEIMKSQQYYLFEDKREEIIQSKQYAKWRAAQLQNCLITGVKPPQPAPTPTDKEMAEADSFVPTHGADYVDLLQIKTMEMEAMKKSSLAQTRPKVKNNDEDSFLDYVDASGTDEVFGPETKEQDNISVGEVVRSILKDVVPTDPQKLLEQIEAIKNLIDSEEQLREVTRIIFEKAVQMPNFSPTYAQMCFALSTLEVESAEDSFDTVNFRKLLVTRCQQVFEKDTSDLEYIECKKKEIEQTSDEEKMEHLIDELEGLIIKNRMRTLGNIRFFGELYKLRMIATKVMHICILRLLKQQDDEESLECLCILLLTIGKDLDSATKGSATGSKAAMNSYFLTLESIVQQRKVSNRTRFMIEDIIELRQNKWKKCRENMVLLQPFPDTDKRFSPCQTDGHFFP